MAIHVAILQRPYLEMILKGRKTVESRLTRTAQPPFGAIQQGERIFFKQSGGPFMATALAGDIESHKELTRAKMRQLCRRLNNAVRGEDAYWQAKADSRYATFIALARVEPLTVGPRYAKSAYKAWFVLDESLSPLHEVTLTAGAIRNRYATLPKAAFSESRTAPPPSGAAGRGDRRMPQTLDLATIHNVWTFPLPTPPGGRGAMKRPLNQAGFDLILPDGRVIHTDLARGRMIRWRGWGSTYQYHNVQPGDVMRFVAVGPRRYRVTFHASP